MEWFFNPWVICVIIIAVIASNIAALKYTAYMRTGLKKRHPPQPPHDESQPSEKSDTNQIQDDNHMLEKSNPQDKND
ncbi:hypothetical protein UA38_09925 [Photobacterium kishitanii]|uniref:DUF2897 domain-containing protein n=2 Tax=Photobacterium kishitanii TaxID=318456 RepID=A0A2T3QUK9_9GAMM|nr:DUF2897 family protein [Photobacterium kishitanii]KJG57623.1 hypothetical protein UA38_09925 [Photobacterium kishitanii]KJG65469.1 hypothetical protein UA40_11840 [Photobacterium kishitanii]PSU22204.1 DUF2897 domain-containing protein [Photobacterium kishitanii]PSU91492.1 DUF2897 domain-containing protein [Photobacterium kishitanii]PSU97573.1 DUF2897 domain-containing protein [Photobacterium kishitanii]